MEYEHSISNPQLRKAMLTVFGGKCFYTGQEVTKKNMTIDHVVPKAKGGKDSVLNYVLTTNAINSQKRAFVDKEKVKNILYLVETVYAPRVISLLQKKTEPHKIPKIPSINRFTFDIKDGCPTSYLSISYENIGKLSCLSGKTIYVYFLFCEKINRTKADIISFPYREAINNGIDSKLFNKATKDLIKVGLIGISTRGEYGGHNPTLYQVF